MRFTVDASLVVVHGQRLNFVIEDTEIKSLEFSWSEKINK